MIFITINTIDDGVSYHGIGSSLCYNVFGSALYTIFRKHAYVGKASWSNQLDRIVCK
jgi:hypothetical protein